MEDTKEERLRFAELMAGMAENYGAEITPSGVIFRFLSLLEFPFATIEAASLRMTRTRKFSTMPNVADFVSEITGSAEDRAEVEFTKTLDAMRRLGSHRSVTFEDPITTATIEAMGGWTRLCAEMTTDQERWFRREFSRIYAAYTRGNITSSQILLGHVDMNNTQFVIGAQQRGGDPSKIQKLLISPPRTVIPIRPDVSGRAESEPQDEETPDTVIDIPLKKIAK